MRRVLMGTFLVVTLLPVHGFAESQGFGFRGWGPRVGVTIDPDQIHFGFHLNMGEFAKNVRFQPNFELGFGDDVTVAAINFEASYYFNGAWEQWTPYAGGGIGVNFTDFDEGGSDTDLGLNILGGIERSLSSGDRFFLELKLGLADSPDAKVTAGWTFYH